jgi:transposase
MDILGIDLAKRTFDATLHRPADQPPYRSFPNTPEGFGQLEAWLTELGVTQAHVCMEATNVYWEALAQWLYARGHRVSVVNPARIKGYAMAEMQRNKTDKLDSRIIAAFCATHHPDAWEPLDEARQQLRALVRHRDDLLQTRLQHQNRLRDTTNATVRASLQVLLDAVASQLTVVEQEIREHEATHAKLKADVALLVTITGVGVVTATKVLAECGDLSTYASAKAAAADSGVTPAHYESGTSVRRKTRISKVGNATVRAALYFPAITAMRACPSCQAFVQRLQERGKPWKVQLVAVMRKLLHGMYGVLKHRQAYDPLKLFGPPAKTT